jgi:hypothetical protein
LAIATERDSSPARDAAADRRFADLLCLWRVCGNAACRRARACRGRPHRCAERNFAALPPGVQDFFGALVAAKSCRMSFEAFQEEMAGSPEAEAYFAWVDAANGSKILSHLRKDSDAVQNAP